MSNHHDWAYREDRVTVGWPKSWMCLRCGHKVASNGRPDPDMAVVIYHTDPFGSVRYLCNELVVSRVMDE